MAKGNFGERLKRERELREVSTDELTKATRISTRFLDALENEEWSKLPGGVFGRGFVRTIARYLGLDEESLLGEYDLAHGEIEAPKPQSAIPRPPAWVVVLTVLAALLALAGVVTGAVYGWRRYAAHRALKKASALSPDARPETPAALGEGAVLPPARELDLSVSTSAATRVRVVADGRLVLDRQFAAGENLHVPAAERFEVAADDSSTVLLELNGQAMPPLGSPGASGTITLTRNDLRQATGGTTQP